MIQHKNSLIQYCNFTIEQHMTMYNHMILYNIMICNAVLSQMIQYHIIIRYNIISFDSKTYLMPYKQISYNMIQYCLV